MRHRIRHLRWPIVLAATALLIGSGTAYAVTRDGPTGSYRTAVAARDDVEQTLSTSGTVDAARRADLEFATSGTVARVAVALGDRVKAGQVVARLDTDALDAAVTRAEAGLARARAQLDADRAAQDETVADATTPTADTPKSSTPTSGTTDQPAAGGNASAAALAALRDQQDAVITAQSRASAAITAAKEALAAQTQTCADAYQEPAEPDPGQDQVEDVAEDVTDPADLACAEALATVQARQDEVSTAQDDLARALATLSGTLTRAIDALAADSSGSTGTTPASGAQDGATPSSEASPSTAGPESATGTVTAARLAADQAEIEQAEADLVEARQQRRQAVVRSTRAGRVVSLPATLGAEVAAGDPAAVVVGGMAVTIQAVVPESKIAQVQVGQPVRVTVPGTTGTAEGTVSAIGLVADSSTGTASYPVTVTVEEPAIPLPAGSQALLAVVVSTASDVVAVPTSAVTRRDDGASVQVWDGTESSRRTVTLGVVGARTVEVTDGLEAGERVVLADLDAAITDAADSINDRGGFGGVPVFRMGSGPGGPPVSFQRAN